MAIDYGKSRVGIAISDPLHIISQPLLTLKVKSKKELIKRLKCIIDENNIGLVIIGNPLLHNGKPSRMSKEIQTLKKKLKALTAVNVKLWDERFTSRHALNITKDIGLRKQHNKIDQIAASIILSEYLDSQAAQSV